MIGVAAGELDDHFVELQLVLADRTTFVRVLVVLMVQLFDFFLGQSLGDLADFVSEVQKLLRIPLVTS